MMPAGVTGDFSLTLTTAPSDADFAAIFQPLDRETATVTGPTRIQPLAILLRNGDGAVTGGLFGRIVYSWLVIEMLFVPRPLRRAGTGRALVAMAEAEARARFCVGMQLTRLEFQARGFYERLGFSCFGEQHDVPPGHRCLYLEKRFDPASCRYPAAPSAPGGLR